MDDDVTDEEVRAWLGEARTSVERYRGMRQRYLSATAESRRELQREWGVGSLGGIDSLLRIARVRVRDYERELERRGGQADRT